MGLRRHHKNPRNSEAMVGAYNVKATPMGLEPYTNIPNIYDLVTGAMGKRWLETYVMDGYVEADYVD